MHRAVLRAVVKPTLGLTGATVNAMALTAVRITYATAQDKEMPEFLGTLHGEYAPRALWVLVVFSCVIAIVGLAWGVVGPTGITLASNFGTFVLYGLTCMWTVVAFDGGKSLVS